MIKFNEVTWYSKFVAILFLLGVLPILVFFMGVQYQGVVDQNNSVSTIPFIPVQKNTVSSSTVDYRDVVTCHDEGNYFVATQPRPEDVGEAILVKYKINKDQKLDCIYDFKGNDFEVNNYPEFFQAIEGHFLVTDIGTSPHPRGLGVYDLNTKKEIFTGTYSTPIEIKNNSITYWTPVKKEVTRENCPNIDEYTFDGYVSAHLESRVVLDLQSLVVKTLGESRCRYTQ